MKKTHKNHNWILPKGLIVLGVILAVMVSCKCKKDDLPAPKPTINSFKVADVSMTSASFSYSAAHYESLSLTVDGKTTPVTGTTSEVDGLKANTKYSAQLTAKNGEQSASNVVSFTTPGSKLKVDSFDVSKITATSITFNFASSSDVTITEETLTNTNSGEKFNVLGKKTLEVTNLEPATKYTFTLEVKDASGTTKTSTTSATTLQKASDWFEITSVTYGKQFAIDGNAVSSELDLKLTNLSSATKTLKSLVADFGKNGKAVKMLRYQYDDSRWTVIKATGDTGAIKFENLELKPGVTVIHTYFSLKPDVGGVSNNATLTFSFVSLDDGEGGALPKGGAFASPIAVGTVNANVEPTEILPSVSGTVTGIMISTEFGNDAISPGDPFRETQMFMFGFYASGPTGARLYSLRLKNPYATFTGLVFEANSWIFAKIIDNAQFDNVSSTWTTENKAVSLVFPKGVNSEVYSDSKSLNVYYMKVDYKNDSNVNFDTNNYTPGEIGFQLASKYDIVILNADNQVVDLSDITVYKLNKVYLTD